MTTTQTADNADAAAASDEHVVVPSGNQAVEPGQPGKPQVQPPAKRLKTAAAAAAAATTTTPQPGVPRNVVPPSTGDLAYGSSHWDGKPAEIHAMILKHAGPLTRFLCGLLGDTATLDEATKLQLWTEALKMDWQGDLALLPDVELTADNGLLLAHSRSMYDRLCKRFPRYTEIQERYATYDQEYNNYDNSFRHECVDSSRLLLIPMRHGWFDLVDFTYPITLARLAIRFGCLDLLKHLDDKYNTLKGWMAKYDPSSACWCDAVDLVAQYGHLDVIQFLFGLGVTACSTRAMDWAAENNHMDVVIWLHENRTEGCTTNAMDGAAVNGHLHVVIWLHENRTEGCTTGAMDWAARDGYLHVIKWLHANRTEGCTKYAMIWAAKHGRLHVVQWLHEACGEACTSAALDVAINSGHVDVVKYMHSKGYRASSDFVERAASAGNMKSLQCLLDCGYAVELGALKCAKTAAIANVMLDSLTLEQAQALLAEASRGRPSKATIKRLESTIQKLQASSK